MNKSSVQTSIVGSTMQSIPDSPVCSQRMPELIGMQWNPDLRLRKIQELLARAHKLGKDRIIVVPVRKALPNVHRDQERLIRPGTGLLWLMRLRDSVDLDHILPRIGLVDRQAVQQLRLLISDLGGNNLHKHLQSRYILDRFGQDSKLMFYG
jgi:hypothetical protein